MELIHESITMHSVEFEYEYNIGGKHCGYAFPCNESGTIPVATLNKAQIENLKRCKSGKITFYDTPHKEIHISRYQMPAEGRCKCGEVIALTDDYFGATQCGNCGQWYNMLGQELKDPEDWEEDKYV